VAHDSRGSACCAWPARCSSRSTTEWAAAERRYLSEAAMAKLYETGKDEAKRKEVGKKTKALLAS
jgi:hypothetical protein